MTTDRHGALDAVADPSALWGLAQVAKYLGRSHETVRLLWQERARRIRGEVARGGGRDALPRPDAVLVTRLPELHTDSQPGEANEPETRPLWRPQTIQLWALTVGHTGQLPGRWQAPAPMWLDHPPSPPWSRVADKVLTIETADGHAGRVHVRAWHGNDGHTDRTVVLLGELTDGGVRIRSAVERVAAAVIQAGLVDAAALRTVWWFLHEPLPEADASDAGQHDMRYVSFTIEGDGAASGADVAPVAATPQTLLRLLRPAHRDDGLRLSSPVDVAAGRRDVEALIGGPVELYPHELYSGEIVTRWAAGERPVEVDVDPAGIARHLQHLQVLQALAARALPDGTTQVMTVHLLAACVAAAACADQDPLPCRTQGSVVHRRVRQLSEPERQLIDQALDNEDLHAQLTTAGLYRHVGAAQRLLDGADGRERSALIAATRLLYGLARRYMSTTAHTRGAVPVRVDDSEMVAGYRATVAWWGPRPQDRDDADALRHAFWPEELPSVRCGYDPFGRLVLAAPDGPVAVWWPSFTPAAGPRGDADGHSSPRFVALADGRIDLVPTLPMPPEDSRP